MTHWNMSRQRQGRVRTAEWHKRERWFRQVEIRLASIEYKVKDAHRSIGATLDAVSYKLAQCEAALSSTEARVANLEEHRDR